MCYLKFDSRLFIFLTLSFLVMTVIGTLTHEFGHYSVARVLGYKAHINYASCRYWDDEDQAFFRQVGTKYGNEIMNDQYFPGKGKYQSLVRKYRKDDLLVLLGGPIQTTLTGTLGLLLLIYFRKRIIKADNLTIAGWALVLVSLFWLRQLANIFMLSLKYFINGEICVRGDEIRIARYLDINTLIIQVGTGIIALIIFLYIIKFIPRSQLLTFLLSGLIGGVAGYYLWIIKFGSVLMP